MNNREFEKTMTDTFSEPEWEEGWERGDMERIYTAARQSLLPVINEAVDITKANLKDMDKIDKLCEMAGVHRYSLMRSANDELLGKLQSARAEIEGSDV